MGASLDRERAVGVGRVDRELGRLDARLLRVGDVEDLDGVAASARRVYIRISVSRKSAASTPPAPERIVTIASRASRTGPGEQGADLECLDLLLDPAELDSASARVSASASSWASSASTPRSSTRLASCSKRSTSPCTRESRPVTFCPRWPGRPRGRQRPPGCPRSAISVFVHGGQVEDLLDRVEGRLELLDLGVEVGGCHKNQDYGPGVPRGHSWRLGRGLLRWRCVHTADRPWRRARRRRRDLPSRQPPAPRGCRGSRRAPRGVVRRPGRAADRQGRRRPQGRCSARRLPSCVSGADRRGRSRRRRGHHLRASRRRSWPAWRSHWPTPTTCRATPAGSPPPWTPPGAQGVLDDEVPVYVELPHAAATGVLARRGRRGRRERLPAEVPHGRPQRRRVPVRNRRWRSGSTLPWTGRRPSSAPPACTTPSGTPPATPVSSITASSTCWSRRGSCSTARRSPTPSRRWRSATRRTLVAQAAELDLAGARRWFTSFGSCSVDRAAGRPRSRSDACTKRCHEHEEPIGPSSGGIVTFCVSRALISMHPWFTTQR